MKCSRWVAVCVDAMTHEVVGIEPGRKFTRFEAWQWMISQAAWRDHKVNNHGTSMVLRRGQLPGARAYLAEKWGWSEKEVRTFCDRLAREEMIKVGQSKGRHWRTIEIANYERYQSAGACDVEEGAGSRPENGPVEGQLGAGSGPVKGQTLTKDTKDTRKDSPQTPHGASTTRDPFGFGNEARNEQASGIVVGKGGQIVLDPPVREQWAQMLGGETALDLALTEIGAEIAASAPRSPSLHVTRRLARMAKDKLDRDSRYAKAAANNAAAKAPAAFASKPKRWWEDPKQVRAKAPTLDAWRSLVTKHANGDWPIYYLGPPPGARGCVVPKEIVEEFELAGRYDEKGFGIGAVAH